MVEINLGDLEKELRKTLSEVGDDAESMLDEIMADASQRVLTKLRKGRKHGGKTPEDTGEYAAGWEEHSELRGVERVRVIRNAAKPYLTTILEYGREGQPAQQHIRLALTETIEEISDELK